MYTYTKLINERRITNMSHTIIIKSVNDLRKNYKKVSELSEVHPVAITVNGREDTALLSYDFFMEQQNYIKYLEAKLALYEHLTVSIDDIKRGRIQEASEAFEDVRRVIESKIVL